MASSHSKLERCRELGAFCGINYKQLPNYSERVQLITNHEGANLILDPVMGDLFFTNNLRSLAQDSKWIVYGFMAGTKIKEADASRLLTKNATMTTTTLRNRPNEYKTKLLRDMERDCLPGFETGELRPVIDTVFPLSDAKYALERMS